MKREYVSPEWEMIKVTPSDVIMSTIGEGGGEVFDSGNGDGDF